MASAAEIAKRYFAALAAQDLDAAVALWAPGAVDRLVGQQELIAPAGITDYFGSLFEAFPDFVLEVLETVSGRKQAVVRWQATGTFAGPGTFQGLVANGARLTLEGCDVVTVEDDLIRHNDAYLDGSDIARQLGILPATGSQTEARLTKLANLRSRLGMRVAGAEAESIADGVWVVRGGFPIQTMNVYLIADDGGVTVFDAGIESMGKAVAAARDCWLRERNCGEARARIGPNFDVRRRHQSDRLADRTNREANRVVGEREARLHSLRQESGFASVGVLDALSYEVKFACKVHLRRVHRDVIRAFSEHELRGHMSRNHRERVALFGNVVPLHDEFAVRCGALGLEGDVARCGRNQVGPRNRDDVVVHVVDGNLPAPAAAIHQRLV